MPSRSALYALQPMGKGSSARESLSSYFLRLADAHNLTPRVLAASIVCPELGIESCPAKWAAYRLWNEPCFNGFGRIPKAWAEALGRLTSVLGLIFHCLNPLVGLVSARNLMARENRWCPVCLHEDEAQGTPHGRLLWEIEAVAACPRHGILLASECGCGLTSAKQPWMSKSLPHICKVCGELLGRPEGLPHRPAEPWQIEQAGLVADLLGSPLFDPNHPTIPLGGVGVFLRKVIQVHGGGNSARVASSLGFGKSALHDWVNGRHIPTLPQVVSIAHGFGCSVLDVLNGEAQFAKAPISRPRWPSKVRKPGVKRDWPALRKKMDEILKMDPGPKGPPTPSDLGRKFGVNPGLLYRYCGEQNDALVQLRKEWLKRHRAEVLQGRIALIRDAAFSLASNGIRPNWSLVRAQIKGTFSIVSLELRGACTQALVEAKEVFDKSA